MKGIYKKISVGVLAAALLVGAGGIAQGGQAFANSNVKKIEIPKNGVNKYRDEARELDIKDNYDSFNIYARRMDRLNVGWLLEDGKIKKAEEIRCGKNHHEDVEYEYKDGWELSERLGELKVGENKVKVRNLYFIIIK